jgi:hypothetical protein
MHNQSLALVEKSVAVGLGAEIAIFLSESTIAVCPVISLSSLPNLSDCSGVPRSTERLQASVIYADVGTVFASEGGSSEAAAVQDRHSVVRTAGLGSVLWVIPQTLN